MNEHRLVVRLLAGVAIMVLVGGCTAGHGTPRRQGVPSARSSRRRRLRRQRSRRQRRYPHRTSS